MWTPAAVQHWCVAGPHVLPHQLTGKPLLRFPLTRSAQDAGRSITCGTCMLVLQHILAALCEMFSITHMYHNRWIDKAGPTVSPPLPDLNPLNFYLWGTPKNPSACSSCWQRRGTSLSHCGCLSDYPQIIQHLWMQQSMKRCVEACTDSHGGHFELLL
jgi:hypothetical protein